LITFVIKNDSPFRRDGNDLYKTEDIDLYTALLGEEKTIDTLGGKIKLKVPPGTQNGTKIRLKGKGFPVYKRESEFGDLYITYQIKLPTGLSDKEKELLGNKLFRNIESRIDAPNPLHSIDSTPSKIFSLNFSKGRKIAAAAIVLFLIGTGVFLLRNQSAQKQIAVNQNDSQRFKNDIGPGGDKAVFYARLCI